MLKGVEEASMSSCLRSLQHVGPFGSMLMSAQQETSLATPQSRCDTLTAPGFSPWIIMWSSRTKAACEGCALHILAQGKLKNSIFTFCGCANQKSARFGVTGVWRVAKNLSPFFLQLQRFDVAVLCIVQRCSFGCRSTL